MRFSIEFTKSSIKELKNLPKSIQELLKRSISERLETDPLSYGKPLRKQLIGFRSLRVSSYRIIYKIEEIKNNVIIIKVGIRRDVYN